jgi:uncharacterized protein YjbI with pentapeptide repeats
VRGSLCLLVSIGVHLLVIGMLLARAPLRASDALEAANAAWFEVARNSEIAAEPAPPSPPPAPAQPPTKTRPQRPVQSPRAGRSRTAPGPRVADAIQHSGGVPEGEGTLPMGPAGDGLASGASEADESQQTLAHETEPARPSKPEPRRERRPAQLSLWLDPKQFEHIALVRPGTAVLMAVPGFRDVLRGSNIRPFNDLERVRITLSGAEAEKLIVAGVHVGGEAAVRDAAKRVAAMRRQEPIWRGDSSLQATSWVDGTNVDRGLALHAVFTKANLRNASLKLALLHTAVLRGADMSGANLREAGLPDADLEGANLEGAYLAFADLGRALVAKANFRGALLCKAVMAVTEADQATFTGARYGSDTKWPPGFDPNARGAVLDPCCAETDFESACKAASARGTAN